MLTATHDKVLRWIGTGWTVIRTEPAEMIAANLTTLAATAAGSGQIELYIDAPGSPPNWKPMAMEPDNSIPFGAGGRMWLGDRSIYYRPPGRDELWGERFVVALPPHVAAIPLHWLLSRTAVAAVAPHQTTGGVRDFPVR